MSPFKGENILILCLVWFTIIWKTDIHHLQHAGLVCYVVHIHQLPDNLSTRTYAHVPDK